MTKQEYDEIISNGGRVLMRPKNSTILPWFPLDTYRGDTNTMEFKIVYE